MRPPITVTNKDRRGNVTNKWHVQVGAKWITVGKHNIKEAIAWINNQLKMYGKNR